MEETLVRLIYQDIGSNTRPMAPTCAESSNNLKTGGAPEEALVSALSFWDRPQRHRHAGSQGGERRETGQRDRKKRLRGSQGYGIKGGG